ncbi:hypothetical protein Tco_0518940 [Tanacetum coccineum]
MAGGCLAFSTSSSSLSSETIIGSSVGELGVKKADLWAVFNPSPADLVSSTRTLGLDPANIGSNEWFLVPSTISHYEDMESLGADSLGSTLAVESAEALCPDADSECK